MIILSFTSVPLWMYYHLGSPSYKIKEKPNYIVVMSGNGMPSESGLIRTYFTAEVANEFPKAKVIVTMPTLDLEDTLSGSYLMKKEIIIRGISENRILRESKGTNTRSQALSVLEMTDTLASILIVTSPEHMYRSIKSFEKVGFKNVYGKSAFARESEASFDFDDKDLGGNTFIFSIGKNKTLRYQFWSNFKLQVIVYREYCAIMFYRLKNWI